MSHKEKEFFDENAHHWDEISVHDLDVVTFLADALKITGHESILDIGTGTGILIPFYRERTDGKITALDMSEKMIEVAKGKYPPEEFGVDYVVSDLYDYETDERFDIIVCYSCFPHFEDKPRAIVHLASFLKNGGKLMISHGCSRDCINRVHQNAGEAVKNDHLPDMPHMEAIVEGAGLEIVAEFDDDRMYGIIGVKNIRRTA